MPTITLNDDTVYEVAWCFADARALMAEILGDYTLLELADVLSHPTTTEHIVFATTNEQTVHEGYTHLTSVTLDRFQPGHAQIILTKTED